MVLDVRELECAYGTVRVLSGISFQLESGTILGIAGEGCHSDGEWADLDCIQAYSEMLAGVIKA